MGYYVIKYLYEPYTLKEDQTTYGQVSKSGELVVKSQYLSIIKTKTDLYFQQNRMNQSVIISTRTIVHPFIKVSVTKIDSGIHRSICDKKTSTSLCVETKTIISDAYCNYILD